MKKRYRIGLGFLVIGVGLWLNNTSLFTSPAAKQATILAHRGAAQTFPKDGLKNDTCTAKIIYPPKHLYIENTLESMQFAFSKGANIVEFDIHITTDNKLAIFHDWSLGCRTQSQGTTQDFDMAYLKTLDIGYGYTANSGETYPFRNKYIGKMPEIMEVFNKFPNKKFLINIKSKRLDETKLLANIISTLPQSQQNNLMIYGGQYKQREYLIKHFPNMPIMTKSSFKACVKDYILIGWSAVVPNSCKNNILLIPQNLTPLIWGWPNKFLNRMAGVNSEVFVTANINKKFLTGSQGMPTISAKTLIDAGYKGGIWTDDIDQF